MIAPCSGIRKNSDQRNFRKFRYELFHARQNGIKPLHTNGTSPRRAVRQLSAFFFLRSSVNTSNCANLPTICSGASIVSASLYAKTACREAPLLRK